MKVPAARERGASVSSGSSSSSVLIRPTVDAIIIVLSLPLLLLIVVLIPWGKLTLSTSPHLQLLGIALTFASVIVCFKIACAVCSTDGRNEDFPSRRSSRQSLLESTEDRPPNYESIMAATSVFTIDPVVSQPLVDPPPYYSVVIDVGAPDDNLNNRP